MGVILLCVSILGLFISRGGKVFYIIYTLQTFALVSFLEIAWLSPLSYLLNSFQYFLPFNLLGKSLKETTWDIRRHSYYRLNKYFYESSLLKSMSILGIMNCVVIFLIMVIPIFQLIRKNNCKQCCRCLICTNWFL